MRALFQSPDVDELLKLLKAGKSSQSISRALKSGRTLEGVRDLL
jgi:hypothetical protein